MKARSFIRRVILFPFSILMGIEGGEATAATTEAGAAPVTATAEAQGSEIAANPDTAGAAPGTGTAEGQGGEGTEAAEAGGDPDRGPHQKTFEERVEEVAAKKVAELEQRLNAKQTATAADKPDFINIDFDALNQHLAGMIAKERELSDQIALDPQNSAALVSQLFQLQSKREQLIGEVRQNEQKKGDWLQKAQAQHQDAQFKAQMQTQIEDAAKLVADEFKIPADVWNKGREFFNKACQQSPLLQRQYDEKVLTQGPVAAVMWAKEYVEQHMGAKEQQLIDQKEAAKQTLPPGKTSTGAVVGNPALEAAIAKAKASPGDIDALAEVSRLRRAAAQQQQ